MTFQHHASHDLLEAVEHWGLEETASDKRQATSDEAECRGLLGLKLEPFEKLQIWSSPIAAYVIVDEWGTHLGSQYSLGAEHRLADPTCCSLDVQATTFCPTMTCSFRIW